MGQTFFQKTFEGKMFGGKHAFSGENNGATVLLGRRLYFDSKIPEKPARYPDQIFILPLESTECLMSGFRDLIYLTT